MPKLKKLSGHELVKILCNKFGFAFKRQKGSHAILIRGAGSDKVGCVVPLHKELKIGTLKGILEQACISEEDFAKQH
jgi:predicted RNA binding protein YcfA (HicA-like mRNA interferase family)